MRHQDRGGDEEDGPRRHLFQGLFGERARHPDLAHHRSLCRRGGQGVREREVPGDDRAPVAQGIETDLAHVVDKLVAVEGEEGGRVREGGLGAERRREPAGPLQTREGRARRGQSGGIRPDARVAEIAHEVHAPRRGSAGTAITVETRSISVEEGIRLDAETLRARGVRKSVRPAQ